MHAKALERTLAMHGANASAVDVVIRKLRDAFKVSTGGRGLNAHDLLIDEIAYILAAYAGSETASRADETLARLMNLISDETRPPLAKHWTNDFLVSLQLILRGELTNVKEVRIARNFDFAAISYADGREVQFRSPAYKDSIPGISGAAFRSDGVLSGALLEHIAFLVDEGE